MTLKSSVSITRAAAAAVLSALALSVPAYADVSPVYHWWCGADNGDIRTATNWKDASGTVETDATKPQESASSADILVFTNFTGTVTTGASLGYMYRGYVFGDGCGAVTLGVGKGVTLLGGPVRVESPTGNVTFGQALALASGTNVIDVVESGAVLKVNNSLSANADSILVKEGKGMFRVPITAGSWVRNVKEVVMRGGTWFITPNDDRVELTGCTITFDGNDPSALVRRGGDGTRTKLSITGGCVRETASVQNTGHGFTDANVGSTLSMTGAVTDSYFTGSIYATMSFLWGPSDSSQTFTFAKAAHPTTGNITVQSGTVRLVDGASFPSVKTVTVKSGATLRAESGVDGAIAGTSLVAESGAVLHVAEGTTLRFASATVAGSALDAGVYTTGFVTGGGAVVVAPSAWPSAATDVWNRDDFPAALASGTTWYKGASLYGTALSLTAADGAAAVIGSTGVTTSGDGAAYTWAWPTFLYGAQTWTVKSGDTLTVAAPLSAMAAGNLTLIGSGSVVFKADQPLSSRIVFSGVAITLDDATISSPVSIYSQTAINGVSGKTSTFAGAVSALNTTTGTGLRLNAGTLRFTGGVSSSAATFNNCDVIVENAPWVVGTHQGTTLVNAGPRFQDYGNLTLSAPSNVISIANHAFGRGHDITIRTTVPYALYRGLPDANDATVRGTQRIALGFNCTTQNDPSKHFHARNCVWDLCGCDQEISGLSASTNGATVTSESPAQLHYLLDPYTQNATFGFVWHAVTNYVQFTGAAGLSYEGTRTDAALVNVSTTTGRLDVASGRLSLLAPAANPFTGLDWPGGSWPNASVAAVSGTGTLALGHAKALNIHGEVRIDGGGKLEIASGVSQRCDNLYIDGVKQPVGRTYGAPGSGASVTDAAHFAGGGVLNVTGEHPAFVIVMR